MKEVAITKADNGGFILFSEAGTEIFTSENKAIKRVRELLADEVEQTEAEAAE